MTNMFDDYTYQVKGVEKVINKVICPKYPELYNPLTNLDQSNTHTKSATRIQIMIENRFQKCVTAESGLLQLNKMDNISSQLLLNSQNIKNGPGYPTSLCCLSNIIAIGTNSSMILLYDNNENPITVLGSSQDSNQYGAVTSICGNEKNHILYVGHLSGKINIWDYNKKQLNKTVDGIFKMPVIFLRSWNNGFIACDSNGKCVYCSVTKKLLMTSVDTTVIPSKYGPILSAAIYQNDNEKDDNSTNSENNPTLSTITTFTTSSNKDNISNKKFSLIAIATYEKVYILSLLDLNMILFEWKAPDTCHAISTVDFHKLRSQGFELIPILTCLIAWGNHLQLLSVQLKDGKYNIELINHIKFEYTIYAQRLFNDHTLVYLTSEKSIIIFDLIALDEIDIISVKDLKFVYSMLKNLDNNTDNYINYENTIAVIPDGLYLLCLTSLSRLYTVNIKTRIQNCIEKKDWLVGFNIILDYYKSNPDVSMLDIFLQYFDLYLDYSFNTKQIQENGSSINYFKTIAGVCCEYSIGIRQSYLLTQLAYKRFEEVNQISIYIQILSSYIVCLIDITIPPPILTEIIEYFCDHDLTDLAQEWLFRLDINVYDREEAFDVVTNHQLLLAIINLSCKHYHSYNIALEKLFLILNNVHTTEMVKSQIQSLIITILAYSCDNNAPFPNDIDCVMNSNNLSQIIDVIFKKDCPENPEPYYRLCYILPLNLTLLLKVIQICYNQTNDLTTEIKISNICTILGEFLFNDSSYIELDSSYDSSYFIHYYTFLIKMLIDHIDCVLPSNLTTSCIVYLLQATKGNIALYNPYTNEECLCKIIDNVDTKHYDPVQILYAIQEIGLKQPELRILKKMNRYGDVIKLLLKDSDNDRNATKEVFSYLTDCIEQKISSTNNNTENNNENTSSTSADLYNSIQPFITPLVKKNIHQTIRLLLQIPETDFKIIIAHLKLDNIYYLFIRELLTYQQDTEYILQLQSKGVEIPEDIELQYFKELCMYCPSEVLTFAQKHLDLPINICIKYCEDYNIIDCTAFLYERVGNSQGAVDLLIRGFNGLLEEMVNILQSSSLLEDAKKVEIINHSFTLYLSVSQDLCVKHSKLCIQTNEDYYQSYWFSIFDVIIETQRRIKKLTSSLFQPVLSEGQRCLNQISTDVMNYVNVMSQYVSLTLIVDRIVTKHKSDTFGGFRATILDLIDTSIFETNLLTICNKLFADDNWRSVRYLKYARTRSLPAPNPNCPICHTNIKYNEKIHIIVFSCGHAYHSKCLNDSKQCTVCYGHRRRVVNNRK